jgi:hypothetical protein
MDVSCRKPNARVYMVHMRFVHLVSRPPFEVVLARVTRRLNCQSVVVKESVLWRSERMDLDLLHSEVVPPEVLPRRFEAVHPCPYSLTLDGRVWRVRRGTRSTRVTEIMTVF